MTVDEIRAMTKEYLTPSEVSSVTGWSVDKVRGYAREGGFEFPVIAPKRPGSKILISRIGFLNYWTGVKQDPKQTPAELLGEISRQLSIQNLLLSAAISKYAPASLSLFSEQIKELEKA